jgi:putative lipoprotein
MRKFLMVMAVLVSGLYLAGNAPIAEAQSTPAASPAVSGMIESTTDMVLSPLARVEVEIIDITGTYEQTAILGRQSIGTPGQTPVKFEVTYDPALVKPGHAYALRVRVYDFGRLMLATIGHPLVISNGNPTNLTVYVHDVGTI